MRKVKALIVSGFGLNCERETTAAFSHCGATAEIVHLNDVLSGRRDLEEFHLLALIGGFSFGDHLGAGTVFANRLKHRLRPALEKFVAAGKLVIGICNGFQTLTRLGLIPGLDGQYFEQTVALAENDSGLFRDDWVYLTANPDSPCVFTRGMDSVRLPIRHGEGRFVTTDPVLARLENENLVVLRYALPSGAPADAFPFNPNGSLNNIAGICDPSGRIFGLMPHPEAYLSPYNAPDWPARRWQNQLPTEGDGMAIFRNATAFISACIL